MFASRKNPATRYNAWLVVLLGLMFFAPAATTYAAPADGQQWRNPAIKLEKGEQPCTNLSNANNLIFSKADGTYLYNSLNDSITLVSPIKIEYCSTQTGYGYKNGDTERKQPYAFTLTQPEGRPIDHLPNYAHPTKPDVYRLDPVGLSTTKLWYSPDEGKSWSQRGAEFGKNISGFTFSYADPKVVYISVITPPATDAEKIEFTIYSSANAGQTWTKKSKVEVDRGSFGAFASLSSLRGAPAETVVLSTGSPGAAIGFGIYDSISTDGGQTFTEVGSTYRTFLITNQLFSTPQGLVQLKKVEGGNCSLSYLKENGQVASQGKLPFNCLSFQSPIMQQNPNNLAVLILTLPDLGEKVLLWISKDSGQTWQKLTQNIPLQTLNTLTFAGDLPLIAINGNVYEDTPKNIVVLDGKLKTAPATPVNTAGNLYFPETGHNLSGVFKTYWEKNGGLAQFGYPKTEVFREYNRADGKFYNVQYFERNRFEHHPEFAGTQYEVLLGLLGNQLTAERSAEAPFKPLATKPALDFVDYFPETRHTLRGVFKQYWEANGGLAIYGYPISEPFEEVNPDDGKTYLVQYFERNRFEHHLENKGTKYEVLLGLLGNTVLQQKGWLS